MLKRLRRGREAIELKIQGLGLPIVLRRSARARRFSLQVSEARRDAVLTLPAFSSSNGTRPRPASCAAQARPAGPAPTTMTSASPMARSGDGLQQPTSRPFGQEPACDG